MKLDPCYIFSTSIYCIKSRALKKTKYIKKYSGSSLHWSLSNTEHFCCLILFISIQCIANRYKLWQKHRNSVNHVENIFIFFTRETKNLKKKNRLAIMLYCVEIFAILNKVLKRTGWSNKNIVFTQKWKVLNHDQIVMA